MPLLILLVVLLPSVTFAHIGDTTFFNFDGLSGSRRPVGKSASPILVTAQAQLATASGTLTSILARRPVSVERPIPLVKQGSQLGTMELQTRINRSVARISGGAVVTLRD